MDTRQGESGAVTLVGGRGEHPSAARLTERHGVRLFADAVDVQAGLFRAEGLAGRGEHRVDDLFGGKATRGGRGEQRAGLLLRGVRGALIGVRIQDKAQDVVSVVAAAHELAAEPAEQFRVGVLGAFPIPGLVHEAATHEAGPEAIRHHLREAFVLRGGDERGESVARILRIEREIIGDAFLRKFGEGPMRLDRGARFEGDLDEGLATAFAEFGHRDTARNRDLYSLGLEEGGEGEDLLLLGGVCRGVVTTRTLGLHAEEGGSDNRGLGGHGDVVLGGDAEAGRAASGGGALEAEELGHHEVERFMVGERFVNPPAEWTGVVQRGIQDVRVLGEDVLPVARPMVGGARVVQQAVDDLRALVGRGVGGEGFNFGEAGRHADGVERDATQEGEVFGQRIDRGGQRAVVGPRGAFLDPLLDGCDFGRGEAMADGRHGFVGILGLNAGE